ncbi:MAG: hypothetical protein ABJC19_11745, partial [Gemmatimonadota bacterium]
LGTPMKWTIAACQGPLGAWPATRPARAEWLARRSGVEVADQTRALVEQDAALLRTASQGERLVFWCEADPYDLADLAAAVAFVISVEPEARLELVLLHEHPEVPNFRGLVQLTPAQLVECFVERRLLRRRDIADLQHCWEALCGGAVACRGAATRRFTIPHLARAMERLGEEAPGPDGLGLTERRLVAAAREQSASATRLVRRVEAEERRPWLGDSMVYAMIDELANRVNPPLWVAQPGAARSGGAALVEAR